MGGSIKYFIPNLSHQPMLEYLGGGEMSWQLCYLCFQWAQSCLWHSGTGSFLVKDGGCAIDKVIYDNEFFECECSSLIR